ncbi:MAG TPA: hypothetical protein VFA09_05295 [Ktedonobacteraceae bacterium]|jgi:hypothetical protein|nr:hypothetical protein [Ktedonobacteraceae bacterium]
MTWLPAVRKSLAGSINVFGQSITTIMGRDESAPTAQPRRKFIGLVARFFCEIP